MRIVAGEARGRRLVVPRGNAVRPTTDRVREALFSSLGSRVQGARVLDLFAGSGALGLEALSRGAARAVFVEIWSKARLAVSTNIDGVGMSARATIVAADAVSFLKAAAKRGETFDLIFMDPPYEAEVLASALPLSPKVLEAEGLVVVEHSARREIDVPAGLRLTRSKGYGDSVLSYFDSDAGEAPL